MCLCLCLPDSIIHHFQCKYGLAFLQLVFFFFHPVLFIIYCACAHSVWAEREARLQ